MSLYDDILASNADYTRGYFGPENTDKPLKLLELDHDEESDNLGGYKDSPVLVPVWNTSVTPPVKNFFFAALDRRWRGVQDEFGSYAKTLFVRYEAVSEAQWRSVEAVEHDGQRYRVSQLIGPQGMRKDWRVLLNPIEKT